MPINLVEYLRSFSIFRVTMIPNLFSKILKIEKDEDTTSNKLFS